MKRNLDFREIYKGIVECNLYTFRVKKPDQVVNSKIRCHCHGINFLSVSQVKYFKVVGQKDENNLYGIFDENSTEKSTFATTKKVKVSSEDDLLPEERIDFTYLFYKSSLKRKIPDNIIDCPQASSNN